MRILLTGGTGTLGKEIIKIAKNKNLEIIAPTSKELDITNEKKIEKILKDVNPHTVVHAAAYTDVKESEKNVDRSIKTNVIGTCNLLNSCISLDIRFVFISTDHVFDGEKGYYKITDPINPITVYAKSKAASELAARMYQKSLIIRTSFFGYDFPYEKAFTDQWSSKDYVDVIAPKVLDSILNVESGIVHCVSERRTLFEIAKQRNDKVQEITRKEINFPTPKDTSLI